MKTMRYYVRSVYYFFLRWIIHKPYMVATVPEHGLRFKFKTEDSLGRLLYKNQIVEPDTTRCFLENVPLQDGDVVLDIGANIGWYALLLAQNSPSSVRIYAFEPDPLNFELLTANVQLNNAQKITGVPKALSDQCETKTLYLYPHKNRGRHSLIPLTKGDGETVQVTTTTLDDFLDEYAVDPARVKFIKMDVEGYEYHVLRGASRLLETVPFVHTEFWPPYFRRGNIDQQGLVDLMFGYHYEPRIINERGGLYEIPYETLITQEQGVNILWVKKEEMVEQ